MTLLINRMTHFDFSFLKRLELLIQVLVKDCDETNVMQSLISELNLSIVVQMMMMMMRVLVVRILKFSEMDGARKELKWS